MTWWNRANVAGVIGGILQSTDAEKKTKEEKMVQLLQTVRQGERDGWKRAGRESE